MADVLKIYQAGSTTLNADQVPLLEISGTATDLPRTMYSFNNYALVTFISDEINHGNFKIKVTASKLYKEYLSQIKRWLSVKVNFITMHLESHNQSIY